MEKLIELLNEYDPYIMGNGEKGDNFWFIVSRGGSAIFLKENGIQMIISKSYGFIGWLVENDKIDISKIKCGYVYNDTEEDKVKNVIMNLSISSSPIEDLISYLK